MWRANRFCQGVWILLAAIMLAGCTRSEDLENAMSRAERAEKTVSSMKTVQQELMAKIKDLELDILELRQPDKTTDSDVSEVVLPAEGEVLNPQEIEGLRQQLAQALTEIKEKDQDIEVLQNMVEDLTQTIHELQGSYPDDIVDAYESDPNME